MQTNANKCKQIQTNNKLIKNNGNKYKINTNKSKQMQTNNKIMKN